MATEGMKGSITIPIDTTQFVEFYPDELPNDVYDLEEVLKDTMAPLSVWYTSAMEYYRQGMVPEFEYILEEIYSFLNDDAQAQVVLNYKKVPGYDDGMLQIYQALAAECLNKVSSLDNNKELSKFHKYIRMAENIDSANPFSELLTGFSYLKLKDYDSAKIYLKKCASNASKSSNTLQYGRVLGFGMIAYFNKQFKTAMDYFAQAIAGHPNAHASVRVAFAVCCFELQQFDRCRLAVERALSLQPSNVDALILMALLERVYAYKNKSKRAEHYTNAYEYCMLASHMDKSNAMALNHIAQYLFFTWKKYDDNCLIIDHNQIQFTFNGDINLMKGDIIKLNANYIDYVQCVNKVNTTTFTLTLVTEIPSEIMNASSITIEGKEINNIKITALKALKCSKVDAVNAESYYILGRLFHFSSNNDAAVKNYEQCLARWPDMPLAKFALGQIFFGKGSYEDALKMFEVVQRKYPSDRDTESFIILIKSLVKSTLVPYDKLKDTIIGFPYEADIWQIQGYLRHGNVTELSSAIKCYDMAIALLKRSGRAIPSELMSNISALHFTNNSYESALDACKQALLIVKTTSNTYVNCSNKVFIANENALFNSDKIFECICQATSATSVHIDNVFSIASNLVPSDDVFLDGLLFTVLSIEGDSVHLSGYSPLEQGASYSLRKTMSGTLLCDATLTLAFNYARILEETGAFTAAIELYEELVHMHPSYHECLMRLGCICRLKGQYTKALHWFSKAQECGGDDGDVYMYMGETYFRSNQPELAKKMFEKDQSKTHRWRLVMGNFYFKSLYTHQNIPNAKFDECLKQSYKYFHSILSEDKTNLYAANGLGMTCAEKGEYEAAREIFTKIREIAPDNLSSIINLGHVHLHQDRYPEAIHAYQTALKTAPFTMRSELFEYLALSMHRNKQFEDAIQTLQRAIVINPSSIQLHFNLAHLREDYAVKTLFKKTKSAREIEGAIENLKGAMKVFAALQHNSEAKSKLSHKLDVLRALEIFCADNIDKSRKHLATARKDEEAARLVVEQQEQELHERLEALHQSKAADLEEAERAKRELQEKAQEKQKHLQALQEGWATATFSAVVEKKTKGSKRSKGQDDSDNSEKENEVKKAKGKKRAKKSDDSDGDSYKGSGKSKKAKTKKAVKTVTESALYDSDEENKSEDSDGEETGPLYGSQAAPAAASVEESQALAGPGSGHLRRNKDVAGDEDEDIEFEMSESSVPPAVSAEVPEDQPPATKVRRGMVEDDE